MNSNNLLAALNYAFQSLGSTGASTEFEFKLGR